MGRTKQIKNEIRINKIENKNEIKRKFKKNQ